MNEKKVIIAGGSGFTGAYLYQILPEKGYTPHLLSRSEQPGFTTSIWDGKTLGPWKEVLENAHAIVNLSGESVVGLWNEQKKNRLYNSRIDSTNVICEAIKECKNPPKVWLNASATGYYGDRDDEELVEEDTHGDGFLAEVCVDWEQAALKCELEKTRVAILRIAGVLGLGEGKLFSGLERFVKMYMGGAIGNGKQYVSWIHIDDFTNIIIELLEKEITGPVNLSSPNPVTNAEMMHIFRKVYKKPWCPPMPEFAVKIFGKKIMGVEPEMVLEGQRVLPQKMISMGYQFEYPELEDAIRDLANS